MTAASVPDPAPRVAVIGIGNVLAGDDAVGPHVVRALEAAWVVPESVEVIDAGTPGLDLAAYVAGRAGVVFVDAIRGAGPPGEVRVLDRAALGAGPRAPSLSPHDPGLHDALAHAELGGGAAPEVRLVGVVAGRLDTGIGLSAPVRAAVPALVAEVVAQLGALGVAVEPRRPPREPDLWWERP